jgi:hypothetical protein
LASAPPSEPKACFQALVSPVAPRPEFVPRAVLSLQHHSYPAPEEQRHQEPADSRHLYQYRVDPLDFRLQSEWLCLDSVTTSLSLLSRCQASSPSPSRYSSAPCSLAAHWDSSAFQHIPASRLEPER